jgi:AbiV family abortive infection protein
MSARLTVQDAAAGAHAAYRNALDLLRDAIHLYEANRYARAVALFILAIEEASKPSILAFIAATDDDAKREEFWKQFTWHRAKNPPGALPFAVQELAIEFGKTMPPDDRFAAAWKDGPRALDLLKQDALYTRQDGSGGWTNPSEKVRLLLAMRLSEIAASCVAAAEQNPVIQEAGMALFVHHVGPALRANAGFREADLAYRKAVIDAKLAPPGWGDPGCDPWLK